MEMKKLEAKGRYRMYEKSLNGKVVYIQMKVKDPYYIQWVCNPAGKVILKINNCKV